MCKYGQCECTGDNNVCAGRIYYDRNVFDNSSLLGVYACGSNMDELFSDEVTGLECPVLKEVVENFELIRVMREGSIPCTIPGASWVPVKEFIKETNSLKALEAICKLVYVIDGMNLEEMHMILLATVKLQELRAAQCNCCRIVFFDNTPEGAEGTD